MLWNLKNIQEKSLITLALKFRQPRAFPQNIALATKNLKI
jgi:hypothetical protein